jgi:hypothetical protein
MFGPQEKMGWKKVAPDGLDRRVEGAMAMIYLMI